MTGGVLSKYIPLVGNKNALISAFTCGEKEAGSKKHSGVD
jgi:hypothetical protein